MTSTQQERSDMATLAFLEGNSEIMTLFFRHISVCPPHGPFKYYSALTFTERLRRWGVNHTNEFTFTNYINSVTPTIILQLMMKYYNTQHLANWPLLYVPAEVRLRDVEAIMNEGGK